MANRLSKISTKTGDKGETGLGDGSRISKTSTRINVIGEVDELNSWVGVLAAELDAQDEHQAVLNQIQHDLFDLGGELCVPGYKALAPSMLEDLENTLVAINEKLPPLKDFILPGGNKAASYCHMARSVGRRAERSIVELALEEKDGDNSVTPLAIQYLNRLSDFFFVLARHIARKDGGQEVLWKSRHTQSKKDV
ncbi:MAG: cob(I)yrinic acid a,c-diamide adenosyltransferase [Oleispira sp.]